LEGLENINEIWCVESRDTAGRKGRGGEGEKENHSCEDFSSPFYTDTSNRSEFFSLYYWVL